MLDGLSRVFPDAPVASVFSSPEHVGDDVVITAAAWERVGGFGFGSGESGKGGTDQGVGGGGGGMSHGRPVAVIRVGEHGVKVVPVVDITRIGITVLATALGIWRALR